MSPRLYNHDRVFRRAFALALVLALASIWIPRWPPFADLPQHAAQVSTLLRWGDPEAAEIQSLLRVNVWTPYLLGYAVTAALGSVLSVPVALKIVLSTAVVAAPLLVWRLLREVGGRPELAILTVPVMIGLPTMWGLLNYVVGLPLLVALLLAAVRYGRAPTPRQGAVLALAAMALVPVHAIIAFLGAALSGLTVLVQGRLSRRAWLAMVPFLTPAPVLLAWVSATGSSEAQTHREVFWHGVPLRPLRLFSFLVSPTADAVTTAAGLALVLLPLFLGVRPTRQRWRYTPLGVLLPLYLFLPDLFFGTGLVAERLVVVLFVAYLMIWDPDEASPAPAVARGALLAAPLLWLGTRVVQATRFHAETRDVAAVIEDLPPHQRVLSLIYDARAFALPAPSYAHLVQWYVTEKGGLVDFSFAAYFPQAVRYRRSLAPELPQGVEFEPRFYDDARWGGAWAYTVVHSLTDRQVEIFGARPVELVSRHGAWWVYASGAESSD